MYPIPANATRIRYLESTGTQYVDTGVNASTTVNAYIKFATTITSGSTAYALWGARVGSGNRSMLNLQYWSGSRQQFRWDYSNDVRPFSATVNSSIHEFQTASNKCTLDGTETQTASGSALQALHVYVFGLNQNGSATMLHAGLRVYAFQLTNGGVLARSFVPVRVGQVGYLFDRVSGQLFGNAGTGSFVLGPDTFQQGVVPTRMMVAGVRKKKVWPTPLYTGVSLVGSSVQNNNGILSGFTSSSYATMPFYWTSGATQIEAVIKVTMTGTTEGEGIWGCVGSKNAFTPFYHTGGNGTGASLGAWLSTNGTSWSAAPWNNPGTTRVAYQASDGNPAAGEYLLKFTQSGGRIQTYAFSAGAWTRYTDVQFGTIYGESGLVPELGTNRGQNTPFLGTIDLNYTYLYRDGALWWEGAPGAYKNVKTTYPD